MIDLLANIYKNKGKEFIDKLFNSHVVVFEQIDGSRFLFQKLEDGSIVYYKKDFEPINYIDRTLMVFYEKAIEYIDGLSPEIKVSMPNNWVFGFQYFPSSMPVNISYDRMPKNHLILTDISIRNKSGKTIKVINDPRILKEWADKLDVEGPPVIFNGRLSDLQKQQLIKFLETADEDLIEIFKTQSFTKYIISILNQSLTKTTLMNDLEKSIEGVIFKFINPGKTEVVHAKIIDPVFYHQSKSIIEKPRKSNDIYQVIMLDIVEFIEQLNINDIDVSGTNKEERYVDLISKIFNEYVSKNGHKYFGVDFEIPDFAKKPDFDLNVKFIKNTRTKELIQNEYLKGLYKIMLSSFKKYRKNPTLILTQSVIDTINSIVFKINSKINEIQPEFEYALDFNTFLIKTNITESGRGFKQEVFEGLNLVTTKQGEKKVNIFVGRFQPFTLGHVKVFEALYKENKLPVVILIVRSGKRPDSKAPFNEDTQLMLFSEMKREYRFLESAFVITSAAIDAIFNQLRPAYEPVLWGAGTDRVSSYRRMITKYKDELNALDEFDVFEIKRTDDDISATKVRNSLVIDDQETFKKMTPKSIHKYYNELKYMIEQVNEKSLLSFEDFLNNSINESLENKKI